MRKTKTHFTWASSAALLALMLAGCGGDDTAPAPVATAQPTPTPSPTPTPTPPPTPDFSLVSQAITDYSETDFAVLIGTSEGEVFTQIKGDFGLEDPHQIASASKWLTAATLVRLSDRGIMSLADRPQNYLSFWSQDTSDPRTRITLDNLLSFASGFNSRPATLNCTLVGSFELQTCVRLIYEDGIDTEPEAGFSYGPEHMHIAAGMAEQATGMPYADLFEAELAGPLGMSAATQFDTPSRTNPLASGGATSTARDYALFLQALLREELVADTDAFLTDRISDTPILFSPIDASEFGEWHYALGSFIECDLVSFAASCEALQVHSSPGSFGWVPWIDRQTGYWGLIARSGEAGSAEVSVRLQQQLQPMIEAALAQ